MTLTSFITAARGAEDLLAVEIEALTGVRPRVVAGGASFDAPLGALYRVCAGSRIAERVLLTLGTFEAPDEDALYAGVRAIAWEQHLAPGKTLAIRATTSRSRLQPSHFIALKSKDAVVDTLRDARQRRPDIDPREPDVQLHVRIFRDRATVSLELASRPRPRRTRGSDQYPMSGGLASAILIHMGWPALAAQGAAFVDPLCGDGRLVIEAASIALQRRPERASLGLLSWSGHDADLWEEALAALGPQRPAQATILGSDPSGDQVEEARAAARHAGVADGVRLVRRDLADVSAPPGVGEGLVVTNPPYGQRLNEGGALGPLYAELGDRLKRGFPGWTAGVMTGNALLSKRVGLKASERVELSNGRVDCRLLVYPLREQAPAADEGPGWRKPSPDAGMLINRLRKNRTRIGKWARRGGVTCYRLYDADIPEYNMAIDWYDGAALIQEYQRPPRVDPQVAEIHLSDALQVVPEVLEIDPEQVFLRVRRRGGGAAGQYTRRGDGDGEQRQVQEGGLSFLINLVDYLDTGLFLDQRQIRAQLRELAGGRRFLNLYAYTCTATVYAAAGGASHTTSVDLSQTYLDWGGRNMALNGFDIDGRRHELIRADCGEWLRAHADRRYGLIYAAPPTFSRSRRADTFDVQRDHVQLIRAASRLLERDGVMIFSNPFQDFVMDHDALTGLDVTEITAAHLPRDFARTPKIFNAWRVTRSA